MKIRIFWLESAFMNFRGFPPAMDGVFFFFFFFFFVILDVVRNIWTKFQLGKSSAGNFSGF